MLWAVIEFFLLFIDLWFRNSIVSVPQFPVASGISICTSLTYSRLPRLHRKFLTATKGLTYSTLTILFYL